MLNNLPQEIRSEKGSKSKFDLQLPRIQQASSTTTYNDSTVTGTTALRFHWLTVPRDYSTTPLAQIDAEYTQLRRELLTLNQQAAKTVQRMALKSKPQRQDGTHLIQVRGKQAENNAAIIGRLRAQLQQLQKRVAVLSQTGKDSIEESIKQTKDQIITLRHKNKEIQQKSKEIGCSIEAGDQAFSELKKLEVEVTLAERKRAKLELRWKETASNMQKVGRNLSEVNDEAQQAETYIQEQIQSSRVDKVEKKFQYLYRQHSHNLQALRKNEESFNSLKQQKYHQCLKQLQETCSRIERVDKQVSKAGEKYIQQKEDLINLEEKLKECIQNNAQRENNIMITEFHQQEQQKQNEKSPEEERFKHTSKITHMGKMRKDDKKTQSQSTYGRISYEQEPSKTRLLNLRINKSVNRKNDKVNHTIDVPPIQSSKVMKKKSTAQSKTDKVNMTNKSTVLPSLKVNTLDLPESQISKKVEVAVQKENKQEDYFQDEQIQQQIQMSFLKTSEKRIEQKSEKAIEDIDQLQVHKTVQHSKPATAKHEQQEEEKKQAESQQDQSQEDDVDLKEFKKSIAAELTGPYTGIGSINIALGQIQNSIKKHESKTRLHNRSRDNPIEQQDQQPLQ